MAAIQQTKLPKYLPKRASNKHRKEYRASLWRAQERRKDDREVEALKAWERNNARGYTEWDVVKKRRFERRH